MEFKKYQHVERFGNKEVESIELGECFVFPKIDGTNASVWMDDSGEIKAGSRNRELSVEDDNAGFYKWVLEQESLKEFFSMNPTKTLYGEWLVPHSIKAYRDSAWRKFYIFDVYESEKPIHYQEYSQYLDSMQLDYIEPLAIINGGSYETFISQLEKNTYLMEDGVGAGEGIVIKNYTFENRFGRTVWAKIVSSEFKEKHSKMFGAPKIEYKESVEHEIVDKYVTQALCEKTYQKISVECDGWESKFIPRLLNTVFYDLIREDSWSFIKEFKNPTLNFKTLNFLTKSQVKKHLPELF
ncbi:MAG: hypothetical protein KAS32_26745 [Candidatus Peribacteraceae bacterium]|nr:hypothetical protein [Candidatus Peribacteraceae bacterium]